MAGQSHRLEKFYSSFGGVDTRSNKLLSNPRTFRGGSKNFRYNFQDEIQKSNGYQHKAASSFVSLGQIEYKFTDPNTGEAKVEYLTVGNDGLLYRKLSHYLKITNLGGFSKYSFYYDADMDSFVFQVIGSLTTIVVTDTTDMTELSIGLNSLGLTTEIVDEDGITIVNSLKLAYLIDVAINQDLTIGINNNISSQYWESVTYPSIGNFNTEVPFVTSRDFYLDSNYEGISYQNLNNCVFITDGGFPMKYDGKVVVREGMPKVLKPGGNGGDANNLNRNVSGFGLDSILSSDGELTVNKTYKYVFQYGYVDFNGSEIMGGFEVNGDDLYVKEKTVNSNAMSITHTGILSNPNFPVFSCKINGNQNIPDAGGTINVFAEHNIKIGMLLRIPVSNNILGSVGFSYAMSYVSAVTSTTITVDFGVTFGVNPEFNQLFLSGSSLSGNSFLTGFGLATTGNFTLGSKIITAIPSTAIMKAGDEVFSIYIASGTRVVSVDSATQITVDSNASTTIAAGALSVNYGVRVKPGATITGTGIPPNTTVTGIGGSGSVLNISNPVSATGSFTYTINNNPTLLISSEVINGGYAQDIYKNKIGNPNYQFGFCPNIPFGAFTRVYRSTADTDSLYKLIDLPLQRSGGVNTFLDTFADGPAVDSLSRLSLDDANQGADLPRACKYLSSWQGQLVQAGRPVDPTIKDLPYPSSFYGFLTNAWGDQDTTYFGYIYSEAHLCDFQSIYWSDVNSPEGFPQDGLHEFLIDTKSDDKIKGIAPNKDALFTFKERSTGVIVGSLSSNDLSLEVLEDDIGLANHRTIQEVRGSLVWLDPINGFYSCVAGRLPENIGFNISDYQKINAQGLDYSKACAANFRKENLYICSVGTTTFVFDYASDGSLKRNCWYIWDRVNVTSILATADDQLFIDDGSKLWKMKTTNTVYDFTDHKTAIDMILNMAWMTAGFPTIDKHWINLWMNSIQGGFTLDISQYNNFLDTLISEKLGINFPNQINGKKAVKASFKSAVPKSSGVSFGLRNNIKNEWVRLQGLEIEFSSEYDLGEPKK